MKTLSRWSRIPALAVSALALALGGCGGENINDYLLGGAVTGLTSGAVVITEGIGTLTLLPGTARYNFPLRLSSGTSFQVLIVSQPADLTCRIANNNGTINGSDVTNADVNCVPNVRLGGTITGLTASGLILANGKDTYTAAAGTTSFFFPTKVGNGFSYGVTVFQQPTGQTCTVQNGSSIAGTTDITNVVVNCV